MSRRFWTISASIAAVAIALAPIIFLVAIFLSTTGRDLRMLFLAGCAVLSVIGTCLVGLGIRRHRTEWILSGSGLLIILLPTFWVGTRQIVWSASETREIVVKVTDSRTNRPVPNTRVYLEHGLKSTKQHTDKVGEARLVHEFSAGGTDGPVCRTGEIYLFLETLSVYAEGYKTYCKPLQWTWDFYGPPLPTVEVSLEKK